MQEIEAHISNDWKFKGKKSLPAYNGQYLGGNGASWKQLEHSWLIMSKHQKALEQQQQIQKRMEIMPQNVVAYFNHTKAQFACRLNLQQIKNTQVKF